MLPNETQGSPTILWTPPESVRETTEIGRYLSWLESDRGLVFEGYADLWKWSTSDLDGFWGSLWDFFQIKAHAPYERVLGESAMPGAEWFPGALVNYAEHLVGSGGHGSGGGSAVVAYSQTRPKIELSFDELRDQVARCRAGLQRLGIGRGDRVAAYLPNIPETLIAFAATSSLGAIWAACAPELGVRSVVDRLEQFRPSVLLVVGSYMYRDRLVDRGAEVTEILARLPSLNDVVHVPYGIDGPPDSEVSPWESEAVSWEELLSQGWSLEFEPVPFNHPLFVLFSSGTTGRPKAIVHGHGGILLEHLKTSALRWDLAHGDRILWFTTTTWMVWNALVSSLLVRSSIVMIDGDPTWPSLDWQWRLAAETQPSCMGMSPAFVMACRNSGLTPGQTYDLSSIRIASTAGSPLPADGYRYIYEQLGEHVQLQNGSGGTDVCTGIVAGSPLLPVYEGEISGPCLGVAARAFDSRGREIVGEAGELVITQPMPSMPIGFLSDDDGSRYRATYFDRYPGVWRQGDLAEFTVRGTCKILGRSDATLNRGGVRLGTSEFYGVVDELPEVESSLIVHLDDVGGGGGNLVLFVALTRGLSLEAQLYATIVEELRMQLSPRHVPDTIVQVPSIPRTITGKKLEMPVKRILEGERPEAVCSLDAVANPDSFNAFIALRETPGSNATRWE